jgi:EAL domain-containing protein (putative c-di-GMP-specific phosphodiesterase class I)
MASIDDSRPGVRNQTSIADLIVKGAIALVTAAFFIGAYLQFQVTFWLALIAALSVYITLLMLHALMRRSERVDSLVSEVSRLEGELARMKGQEEYSPPARTPQPRAPAPGASAKPPAAMRPGAAAARGDRRPSPPVAEKGLQAPARGAQPPQAQQPGPPVLPTSSQPIPGPHLEMPPQPAPRPGKAAGAEQMHDYWSFRPTKQPLPDAAMPPRRAEPAPTAGGERETDLEAVQGMIKRLADELSVGIDAPGESASQGHETAMRASVDALHTTADTMRAATRGAPPASAQRREPPSMPPPIAPSHTRLSTVASAIAAGRIDVLLRSIIGLADQQVHHYELTICLRDEKGAALPLVVHDPQLARTGLHPLIDVARLTRASRICRSLSDSGHKQCVFSPTSAEALGTDRFLDELANTYRQREALAGELVLTFSHADVRTFGGTEWSALTDMRDLGFRFGLEDVTDVDYEFTALRAAGFAFLKVDAARLLRGLPGPAGVTPGAEVSRRLGELGFAVIVGGIGDEATRAAVLDCGVPLGEGPLFGPPRPVGADVLTGSGNAAA